MDQLEDREGHKVFEAEPMRNRLSASAGTLCATSALPSPAIHSGPFLRTSASDTPGVWVSARIFSSFVFSAAMEGGAIG